MSKKKVLALLFFCSACISFQTWELEASRGREELAKRFLLEMIDSRMRCISLVDQCCR